MRRYRALRIVSNVYRAFGYLCIIAGVVTGFVVPFTTRVNLERSAPTSSVVLIVVMLCLLGIASTLPGLLLALFFFGLSELVQLLMDVADGIRGIGVLLQRQTRESDYDR